MKTKIVLVLFVTLAFGCNTRSTEIEGVWERQYDGNAFTKIGELLTITHTSDGYTAEFYGWDFNKKYRKKQHALTITGNKLEIGQASGLYNKSTDQLAFRGRQYLRLSKEEANSKKAAMDAVNATVANNEKICEEIQAEVNAKQAEGATMSKDKWNKWVDKIGERVPANCIILGDGKRF